MPTDEPPRRLTPAGKIEVAPDGSWRIVLDPHIEAVVTRRDMGAVADPKAATLANVRRTLRRAARREFNRAIDAFLAGWRWK